MNPPKISEAFVISAQSLESFNDELAKAINRGYQPQGAVAMGDIEYSVLMVKFEVEYDDGE